MNKVTAILCLGILVPLSGLTVRSADAAPPDITAIEQAQRTIDDAFTTDGGHSTAAEAVTDAIYDAVYEQCLKHVKTQGNARGALTAEVESEEFQKVARAAVARHLEGVWRTRQADRARRSLEQALVDLVNENTAAWLLALWLDQPPPMQIQDAERPIAFPMMWRTGRTQ